MPTYVTWSFTRIVFLASCKLSPNAPFFYKFPCNFGTQLECSVGKMVVFAWKVKFGIRPSTLNSSIHVFKRYNAYFCSCRQTISDNYITPPVKKFVFPMTWIDRYSYFLVSKIVSTLTVPCSAASKRSTRYPSFFKSL